MLEDLRAWIGAPHTRKIADTTNPCPICGKTMYLATHYGSMMRPEVVFIKCPTHGELKRLYSKRPEARYERSYWTWLTGEYRKKQLERLKEI